MAKQQETVRAQIEASEKAKADLAEAERKQSAAVEEARLEAAKIREDARADSQRISAQLREQADVEVERIKQQGQEQIVLQRQQLIRSLKADLGRKRSPRPIVVSAKSFPTRRQSPAPWTGCSVSSRGWPANARMRKNSGVS